MNSQFIPQNPISPQEICKIPFHVKKYAMISANCAILSFKQTKRRKAPKICNRFCNLQKIPIGPQNFANCNNFCNFAKKSQIAPKILQFAKNDCNSFNKSPFISFKQRKEETFLKTLHQLVSENRSFLTVIQRKVRNYLHMSQRLKFSAHIYTILMKM